MLSHENIHQNKKILRNLPGFEPGAMVFSLPKRKSSHLGVEWGGGSKIPFEY